MNLGKCLLNAKKVVDKKGFRRIKKKGFVDVSLQTETGIVRHFLTSDIWISIQAI